MIIRIICVNNSRFVKFVAIISVFAYLLFSPFCLRDNYYQSHFSVWFGEKNRQQQRRHTSIYTDEQCDNNIRYYMLDISKDYSRFNLDNEKSGQTMRKTTATKTCRIIVAKFKAKTIITKLYNIDDFDLFLQLTYGNFYIKFVFYKKKLILSL